MGQEAKHWGEKDLGDDKDLCLLLNKRSAGQQGIKACKVEK